MTDQNGRNGDGLNWKILVVIITLATVASSLFGAGILYGGVATKKEVEENFLRKDGKELEGIRNELRNLDRSMTDLTSEVRAMKR